MPRFCVLVVIFDSVNLYVWVAGGRCWGDCGDRSQGGWFSLCCQCCMEGGVIPGSDARTSLKQLQAR